VKDLKGIGKRERTDRRISGRRKFIRNRRFRLRLRAVKLALPLRGGARSAGQRISVAGEAVPE